MTILSLWMSSFTSACNSRMLLVLAPFLFASSMSFSLSTPGRCGRSCRLHPSIPSDARIIHIVPWMSANDNHDDDTNDDSNTADTAKQSSPKEDPFRQSRRPSLHPLTINILADALSVQLGRPSSQSTNEPPPEPLQIALAAGKLAASAIQKRQETSQQDGMELTLEEQQTVAGRVVGVVMRQSSLETVLRTQCASQSWIAKYGEWNSFGLTSGQDNDTAENACAVADDPLLRVNRAECLLALFLHTVERPELAAKKVSVVDESKIDFLDADRREVLLV